MLAATRRGALHVRSTKITGRCAPVHTKFLAPWAKRVSFRAAARAQAERLTALRCRRWRLTAHWDVLLALALLTGLAGDALSSLSRDLSGSAYPAFSPPALRSLYSTLGG